MDGPHNLHGWPGFDAIPYKDQPDPVKGGESPWLEPEWEGPFVGIYSLMSAPNLDRARWGREMMHPRDYLNAPYDELWVRAVALMLLENGSVSRAELTGGSLRYAQIIDEQALDLALAIKQQALTEAVPGFGKPVNGSYTSDTYMPGEPSTPRYQVGQKVRAVLQAGSGHSRQYPLFRGRIGTIVAQYPVAKSQ